MTVTVVILEEICISEKNNVKVSKCKIGPTKLDLEVGNSVQFSCNIFICLELFIHPMWDRKISMANLYSEHYTKLLESHC